jgi:hypothetical protein
MSHHRDGLRDVDNLLDEGRALLSVPLNNDGTPEDAHERAARFFVRSLRLIEREFGHWNAYGRVLREVACLGLASHSQVRQVILVLELVREELDGVEA